MKKYRIIALATLVAFLLSLSGCRYRLSADEATPPPPETATEITLPDPEITTPDEEDEPPQQEDEPPPEYIYEAHIDAADVDFSPLIMELEAEDARRYGTEEVGAQEDSHHAVGIEAHEEDETDNIITIEQPSDTQDDAVIGADGGVVGLIATYSTILRQGVNSIFPCQLLYVYAETPHDLVTVGRNSDIYRLVADSGGLNVSSRLAPDNLTVTADWVVRRNPDVIVKFVDPAVLGSGITSTHAASETLASIQSRPDWGATEAVRTNRIILLSEQMLTAEAPRLAAQLLIAYTLYPELFEGIDINGAIAALMQEVDGVWFYGGFVQPLFVFPAPLASTRS
jgi:hypothetical protein